MSLRSWLLHFAPNKNLSPQEIWSELIKKREHLSVCGPPYSREKLELQILWLQIKHPHYNSSETRSIMDTWENQIGTFTNPDFKELHLQMGVWGYYERGQFEKIEQILKIKGGLEFRQFELEKDAYFIHAESWKEITWSALWQNRSQIRPWALGQNWSTWPIEWIIHLADPESNKHPDFQKTRDGLIASVHEFDINSLPDCIKNEWFSLLES